MRRITHLAGTSALLILTVAVNVATGEAPASECADGGTTGDGGVLAKCASPDKFPGCRNDGNVHYGSGSGKVLLTAGEMDVAGKDVALDYTYKVDVDPVERGCVSDLAVQIHFGRQAGVSSFDEFNACILRITFATEADHTARLQSVYINANSFCPGFLDDSEGQYQTQMSYNTWFTGVTNVPGGDQPSACVEEEVTLPRGPFTLLRQSDGRALTMTFDNIHLWGSFTGHGETEVVCPAL